MNYEELYRQIKDKKSCLCVGLDTDIEKIPEHLRKMPLPLFEFNKQIIDATAKYCIAYKPNTAFYEAEGAQGWKQLEMTASYIKEKYPEIFLIADAKRGDIGNTAERYAKAFFEKMNFDAVTLSPYMGCDSIEPFLKYQGKWAIILALTSNTSAEDFETSKVIIKNPNTVDSSFEKGNNTLYESVIRKMMNLRSDTLSSIMFVVGATRPQELAEIRKYCPKHFLLVPGVGAQGGTAEEVIRFGANSHCGLLINSSRGIIYASSGMDFAERAAEEAKKFHFTI